MYLFYCDVQRMATITLLNWFRFGWCRETRWFLQLERRWVGKQANLSENDRVGGGGMKASQRKRRKTVCSVAPSLWWAWWKLVGSRHPDCVGFTIGIGLMQVWEAEVLGSVQDIRRWRPTRLFPAFLFAVEPPQAVAAPDRASGNLPKIQSNNKVF